MCELDRGFATRAKRFCSLEDRQRFERKYCHQFQDNVYCFVGFDVGIRDSVVLESLCYTPEGRGFEAR
jgi:hypothetical protein